MSATEPTTTKRRSIPLAEVALGGEFVWNLRRWQVLNRLVHADRIPHQEQDIAAACLDDALLSTHFIGDMVVEVDV